MEKLEKNKATELLRETYSILATTFPSNRSTICLWCLRKIVSNKSQHAKDCPWNEYHGQIKQLMTKINQHLVQTCEEK